MLGWWRRSLEVRQIAATLEAENEKMRTALDVMEARHQRAMHLVRLLRDVNADLDAKLLEATNEQS